MFHIWDKLEYINNDIDHYHWSNVDDMLKKRDYDLIKRFYDKIDERTQYFRNRLGNGGFDWNELQKLNKAIFDEWKNIYDKITWFHNSVDISEYSKVLKLA